MVAKNSLLCLSQTLIPIISGLAEQNEPKFFKSIYAKIPCRNFFARQGTGWAGAEGQKIYIWTQYLSCLGWDRAKILFLLLQGEID